MTSPLGPSGLNGYDFTRIKAFGQNYFIPTPGNNPNDGDFLQYDTVDGIVWGSLGIDPNDYILKPSGPTTGDFLGYNGTTWVAAQPATYSLPLFSAYNDTATVSVASNADIAYDTEVEKDTDFYMHTTSAAGVTVLQTGLYYVQVDGGFESTSGSGTNIISSFIKLNGTAIAGMKAVSTMTASSQQVSHSMGRVLSLTANDVIKHYVEKSGAGTLTVSSLADTCRMTISTLAATEATFPSSTAGTPMGLLLALTYAA